MTNPRAVPPSTTRRISQRYRLTAAQYRPSCTFSFSGWKRLAAWGERAPAPDGTGTRPADWVGGSRLPAILARLHGLPSLAPITGAARIAPTYAKQVPWPDI